MNGLSFYDHSLLLQLPLVHSFSLEKNHNLKKALSHVRSFGKMQMESDDGRVVGPQLFFAPRQRRGASFWFPSVGSEAFWESGSEMLQLAATDGAASSDSHTFSLHRKTEKPTKPLSASLKKKRRKDASNAWAPWRRGQQHAPAQGRRRRKS